MTAGPAAARDRTASLVNQQGNHNKFYVLKQSGPQVFIAYGRIGSKGQTLTLNLPTADAAAKEFGRRLAQKLRRQYVDESLKIVKGPGRAATPSTSAELSESDSLVVANRQRLGIKTKTVHAVSYDALERLIQEVYGHDYQMIASEEWGNDSQHEFVLDGKNDEWDQGHVADFMAGKLTSFGTHAILNDLVKKGRLAPGTYLVDVSW